jgi:hypothetical protein
MVKEFLLNNGQLILGFLFGLCASIAVEIFRYYFIDRKKFKREYTERQIKNLYGQLYSLVLQNKIYSDRHDAIDQKYNEEFCSDKQYSYLSGETVDKEADGTLRTYEHYTNKLLDNNKRIFDIITNNFEFFDLDDHTIIPNYFIKDYVCFEVENHFPLPKRIARALGGPMYSYYMRPQRDKIIQNKPEFIELVETKYKQKQAIVSQKNIK